MRDLQAQALIRKTKFDDCGCWLLLLFERVIVCVLCLLKYEVKLCEGKQYYKGMYAVVNGVTQKILLSYKLMQEVFY